FCPRILTNIYHFLPLRERFRLGSSCSRLYQLEKGAGKRRIDEVAIHSIPSHSTECLMADITVGNKFRTIRLESCLTRHLTWAKNLLKHAHIETLKVTAKQPLGSLTMALLTSATYDKVIAYI
ncbi:hypothetical protein PFISCL1PPCAC_11598, partial [Pristionchus fissidentatus]